jgi:uncharacterized protein YecE (DUF72 family)
MTQRGQGQLNLFAPAPIAWRAASEIEELGRELHPLLHLGTSSWTFPGWAGHCYAPQVTEAQLQREGLSHYARWPLFRTVGIDRSHYAPLGAAELASYASQLPEGFRCLEKVWDRIVTPVFPHHPRFGERKGKANESFLDPALFREAVWAPHENRFEEHLAAFVLEFPPMPPSARPKPGDFAEKLARFLDAAPNGLSFAVELRNRELLTDRYLRVLADHGAAHVYNYWERMPMPGEQLDLAPPTTDFLVARLMLRPGTRYEERKAAFAPFDRLVDPSEELRADVERLARLAIGTRRKLFVVVNNKAEGSAPLTVHVLAERLRKLREEPAPAG